MCWYTFFFSVTQSTNELLFSSLSIISNYPILCRHEANGKERSALLALLSCWFVSGRPMTSIHQGKLLEMIKKDLSLHSHQIKIGALKVLGTGTHVLSAQDRSLANNIMVMINRHTKNQGN